MPINANGTITKLTNGTAIRLDNAPTSEASPKNHRVSGSSATVITSCPAESSWMNARRPRPRACRHNIRNDTPTNDSQKPAASTASGSNSRIAIIASASDCAPLLPRRLQRASATTAIISNVRTVGRPNPARAL
jgi:hypothetical protein